MGREENNYRSQNRPGQFSKNTLSRDLRIKKVTQFSPMLPDSATHFTKNPEFMMKKK